MIKANELRIGNYVNGGTVYLNQMVVGITPSEIITINGKHYDIEDDLIQPIPLTPEILEKAGFEKSKFIQVLDKYLFEAFQLRYDLIDKTLILDCEDSCYSTKMNDIIHLHQLQNLFFALTGNELEINLK